MGWCVLTDMVTLFCTTMFRITPIVKNILIICGIVFLAERTFGPEGTVFFNKYLALHGFDSDFFRPYQLFTHLFLHANFTHLLLNALALWVFGTQLEVFMGPKHFLNFLVLTGIFAGLVHCLYLYAVQRPMFLDNPDPYVVYAYGRYVDIPTVGISGAIFACMAAFALLFPNYVLYVYFVIPIKVKWFILILIGYEVIALAIRMDRGEYDVIARVAHVAGAGAGAAWTYYWYLRRGWRP